MTVKVLPEYLFFLDIIKHISVKFNMETTINIVKEDPVKILNNLTYSLTLSNSELDSINKSQRNIDVIRQSAMDAIELRKKIQLENQEVYKISINFCIYSDNINSLYKDVYSFKNKFLSQGVVVQLANFRHKYFYLNNLFLSKDVFNSNSKLILTTDALSNLFPFFTCSLLDENGVIIGREATSNSMCILNIFSNKYENSNVCIFGCSGSGKSFLSKLFILRNYLIQNKQVVLDVEGEYINFASNLNACIVGKDSHINILEISSKDILNEDYLNTKIYHVKEFLEETLETTFNGIEKYLKEVYLKYKITDDIESVTVYEKENEVLLEGELLSSEYYPTLYDLKQYIDEYEPMKYIVDELNGKLKLFSKKTNVNLNDNLVIWDLRKYIKYPQIVSKIIDMYSDYNDKKTIIYIDELWKYSRDEIVLESILNLYKTIRKRNGSIITITQDITDFLEYKGGYYANGILNNSCFKFVFKTEYDDGNKLKKFINIEENNIRILDKGEVFLVINKNVIRIRITSNEFERECINENDNSN